MCFLLFHSEIKNNLVNFFVSSNLPDVFIFNLNGRAWRGTLSSALLNIPPIFSETCDDLRSFIYQPGTRTNQNPRTSNCFHSYSHPGIASVKFHYSATITVTRSFLKEKHVKKWIFKNLPEDIDFLHVLSN